MYNIIRKIVCVDTKSLQVGLALYAFLWGIWLILYLNSFNISRSFIIMEAWGGETLWGTLLILLAVSKILSLKLGKLLYREITISFTFIIFGSITLCLLLSNTYSTGIPAFLALTILAGWTLTALFAKNYRLDECLEV